jgi:hypothetical protein
MAQTVWLSEKWLRDHFNHGLRPHHYQLILNFPLFGSPSEQDDHREMTNCMCKTAMTGVGYEIGSIEMHYHGLTFNIAGDTITHGQLELSFMNDANTIYMDFGDWQDFIVKIGETGENIRNVPSKYRTNAQVNQFDHNEGFVWRTTFMNSWPSKVSNVEVGQETFDTIEEYQVTMEYDWHYYTSP